MEPLRSAGAGLAGGRRGTVGRGAVYASQVSESAPKVVYTPSVEEVAAESQGSLKVDINSADVEELDELPGVGPEMTEAIIEYRRANGSFTTVDELEGVPGIGPTTIQKIELFATACWIGRVHRRTDAALAQVTQETWPPEGGWGPGWSGAPNTHERADHKNHKK